MTSYKYIYHNDLLLPDGNPQFLSCNDRTSLVFENVKINGSDQTTMSVNQGIIYNNPSTYNIIRVPLDVLWEKTILRVVPLTRR